MNCSPDSFSCHAAVAFTRIPLLGLAQSRLAMHVRQRVCVCHGDENELCADVTEQIQDLLNESLQQIEVVSHE